MEKHKAWIFESQLQQPERRSLSLLRCVQETLGEGVLWMLRLRVDGQHLCLSAHERLLTDVALCQAFMSRLLLLSWCNLFFVLPNLPVSAAIAGLVTVIESLTYKITATHCAPTPPPQDSGLCRLSGHSASEVFRRQTFQTPSVVQSHHQAL